MRYKKPTEGGILKVINSKYYLSQSTLSVNNALGVF